MSDRKANVLEHPEVQVASTGRYLAAFALSLGLMLLSSWLLAGGALSGGGLIAAITGIAVIVLAGQAYLLFKLDLSSSRMWHTISLVMTVPLFVMAVGLTIWMFHTLALRTTLPGA